jgi:hypothetical protein
MPVAEEYLMNRVARDSDRHCGPHCGFQHGRLMVRGCADGTPAYPGDCDGGGASDGDEIGALAWLSRLIRSGW